MNPFMLDSTYVHLRPDELTAGQTFVVPRGVWHRGIVRQPGELMFITPGAGTDHRPVRL
jgi:hypothetical protein